MWKTIKKKSVFFVNFLFDEKMKKKVFENENCYLKQIFFFQKKIFLIFCWKNYFLLKKKCFLLFFKLLRQKVPARNSLGA